MNKIQRPIVVLICLLTVLRGFSANYKILELNKAGGDGECELTAKKGSTDITAGTTEIPYNAVVTLTVTPSSGYYLQSLSYEEVTDLGGAQSRIHRAPTFQMPHIITLQNADAHYGGNYTFNMPDNNVIVTATFAQLSSIADENPNTTITISIGSTPITYDGQVRPLIVKDEKDSNNPVILTQGTDYRITGMTLNGESTGSDYTIKRAGEYIVNIEGIGKYQGAKTSSALTIGKKALKITAKNQTYTYSVGGTITNGTGQVTIDNTDGLVSGDALSSITLTQSTTNVTDNGTIVITDATTNYGIANYETTFVAGTLVINPLAVGDTSTGTKAVVTLTGPTTDATTGIKYYNHDGDAHVPTVAVTHGSNTLSPDTDYDLAVTGTFFPDAIDNIKPDIYTITVTFKGNYSGSMTTKYQIKKALVLSNTHKWMTYFDPDYNIYVPENNDFDVFTVGDINAITGLSLVKRYYIPKNVPMMIYRKSNSNFNFYPELVESCPSEITSNAFFKGVGVEGGTEVTSLTESGYDIWILKDDQFIRTNSGIIQYGKCYLKLSSSGFSVPSLSLSRKATGISPIMYDKTEDDTIYDLSGRRVSNPQKGLYIQNGKKIVIR